MKPLQRHVATMLVGCFPVWLGAVSSPGQEATGALTPDQQQILHVLNRITFGPRPGDVAMVQQMGLQNYLQQQLHPEMIDDSAAQAEVRQFKMLQMSETDLVTMDHQFLARILKAKAAQNAAQPGAQANGAATPPNAPFGQGFGNNGAGQNAQRFGFFKASGGQSMFQQPESPALAEGWNAAAAIGQLEKAKLVLAVDSKRQLKEVLVDFWSNHFNIDVAKGLCRVMKVADDRDVIRPNVFGRFRDLLEASAKSPAMLFYLDNAQNSASSGNENYGREIMELHTLGVNGGYTQKDVQEVARCFTGWTINRRTGMFEYHPYQHDNGAKVVLGQTIPAGGGISDGERVMDILCASPATAHHIALEMCERFVSDTPPEPLVQRIAAVFQQTDGDLRQVTAAILTSPEFLSPSDYSNKIKSPLEFAVSAVRATGSSLEAQAPAPYDRIMPMLEGAAILGRGKGADRVASAPRHSLNWNIYTLGEPLFDCNPPTGYPEVSKNWVGPGALISRLNFAMDLTEKKVWDVKFDPANIITGTDLDHPETVLDRCVNSLLQGNISAATRAVLDRAVMPAPGQDQTVDPTKLIALILGSPEFQRK
jgi:uncharacterized protein (DUF1800 family)